MTINILFAARPERWVQYEKPLLDALAAAGITAHLSQDIPPEEVDYIVYAPNSTVQDFAPYTRAKAVLNLWAGVESIVSNPTLNIPLARMVDPGLTQAMKEWVVGHVLRLHLGMDAQIADQSGNWNPVVPPLASERRITVFGLGELGQVAVQALSELGFVTQGWSRRMKTLPGVECYAGQDGLKQVLQQTDIAVLLLPDTPDTQDVFNQKTLSLMPKGAQIINPGRGTLIDDAALLDALNSGQIAQATLDVFRTEPLPADHPYWAHPKVLVTPHIAAETRASTASKVIAENILRGEAGERLLHIVDRTAGY